jgi:hypothetical protein
VVVADLSRAGGVADVEHPQARRVVRVEQPARLLLVVHPAVVDRVVGVVGGDVVAVLALVDLELDLGDLAGAALVPDGHRLDVGVACPVPAEGVELAFTVVLRPVLP